MKKSLFNPLLLLAGLLVSNLSVAQVTPISGVVEPEISTAESPKWYTMMSSHLTASDRQNRFMKWDGSNLCTDQLTTPPTDAAYIWRLEKSGRRRQLLRTGSFKRYAHCCSSRSYRYQQYDVRDECRRGCCLGTGHICFHRTTAVCR